MFVVNGYNIGLKIYMYGYLHEREHKLTKKFNDYINLKVRYYNTEYLNIIYNLV